MLTRASVVMCVLAVAAVGAGAQPLSRLFEGAWRGFDAGYFASAPGIPDGGFGAEALAVGDMNGDGIADAVVSHSYFGFPGVSVMLGLGEGCYGEPNYTDTAQNSTVFDVELYDYDADDDLDVFATINGNSGNGTQVAVWHNNGSGVLGTRRNFTVGTGPMELEVADITGDGFADIIVTDNGFIGGGNTVSVLRHNGQTGGAAGFLAKLSSPTVDGPWGLAIADINGDTIPDAVVVGSRFRQLGVSLGTGGGAFDTPTVYQLGANFAGKSVAAADLDLDGDVDVCTSADGKLRVWRNDGAGALGGNEQYTFGRPTPVNAYRMRVVDIDGDGWPDVLTANANGRAGESWNLVRNNGAGGFEVPVAYGSMQNTQGIEAVDTDGDGDLDVITLAHFSNAIGVYTNDGQGVFSTVATSPQVETLSEALAAADVDGDGDTDVVTIASGARVLRNNGDATFASPLAYPTPIDAEDIVLADLNGDGMPDMLLGPDPEAPPYNVGVSLNDGSGGFGTGFVVQVNSCGKGHVVAGDFDNDGDLDAALTEEQACFGDFVLQVYVLENDGAGNLALVGVLDTFAGPFRIETADLDLDGNLDLVTVERGFGLGVFLGHGDMTFGAEIVSTISPAPYQFTLADFDGDGVVDAGITVEASSSWTDIAGVCLGTGTGWFVQPSEFTPASSTLEALRVGIDLDAIDADHDGTPDLAVTNYASNDITILLSDGDGTLTRNYRYGAELTPLETAVGDFDGDGLEDLCSLVGVGNFGNAVLPLLATTGTAPCDADFNSDGSVNTLDVLAFLNAWSAGDPRGDFNDDGAINTVDVLAFLNAWNTGCP